jgi:hypothetical protein
MDRKDTVPVRPSHPAQAVLDQVGYRLKQAHVALCGAMDQATAPPGLTVPQYAERVLRALQRDGLLTRPDTVTT